MISIRVPISSSSPTSGSTISRSSQSEDVKAISRAIRRALGRDLVTFDDLWIQTKGDEENPPELVRFKPNAVQEIYLDKVAPLWREGVYKLKGSREDILKSRQFGFSTLILALLFLDTVNTSYTRTVIMAHDGDSTEALFEIIQRFHDNLPESKRPRTKYANRRMISYPDLGSSLVVRTAGTKSAGRSLTIHNLHCSEVAFYKNPKVFTGLLQAVPAGGNVFKETTANGDGTPHHTDYLAAKDGKNKFSARFFPWFQHLEYQTPPRPGFTPVTWPTEEKDGKAQRVPVDRIDPETKDLLDRYGDEMELQEAHGLTLAQLQWRRDKINEPGMGNMFRQEYPANDVEAFNVSGLKFFPRYNAKRHVVPLYDIPPHWTYIGGLDWGYGVPYCFLLGAIDEYGNVVIVDELYEPGREDKEQAEAIVRLLKSKGLDPRKVQIAADPAMWHTKRQGGHLGKANIEAFQGAGLNVVPAENTHKSGWANLRQYLADDAIGNPKQPAALAFIDGKCPNLVRTLPMQVHGKGAKVEDIEESVEHHAPDALRYLLHQRLRATKPVQPAGEPMPPNINPELLVSEDELRKIFAAAAQRRGRSTHSENW
jgi:hypothetical protein